MSKEEHHSGPIEEIKRIFSPTNIGEIFIIRENESSKRKIIKRIKQAILFLSMMWGLFDLMSRGFDSLQFSHLPKAQQKLVLEINQKYNRIQISNDMQLFNKAIFELNGARRAIKKGDVKTCLDHIINAKGFSAKIKILDTKDIQSDILLIEKQLGKYIVDLNLKKGNR